jgi:lipopolysaccharide/colanic/teichoic acid biosynthesis glycosyltransferase
VTLDQQRKVKRAIDVAVSGATLLITGPAIVGAAAAVRATLGAPVFFCQQRPGLHGKPFTIWKFRTMTDARGPDGKLLPDDQRLTRVGRFLRSSSLDELPQLLNVLKGEMSLVGPRPLLMQYLDRYDARQARRHDVPPGVTGLAQVRGRNALSWEEKFELDVEYVDRWSLWLDLRILAETALRLVDRRGISQAGHVTMPEFMGSGSGAP